MSQSHPIYILWATESVVFDTTMDASGEWRLIRDGWRNNFRRKMGRLERGPQYPKPVGPPVGGPEQMRPTSLSPTPIVREVNLLVAKAADQAHRELWEDKRKRFQIAGVLPFLVDLREVDEQPGRPQTE